MALSNAYGILDNYVTINTGLNNQTVGSIQYGSNGDMYVFDGTYWQSIPPVNNINHNPYSIGYNTSQYNSYNSYNTSGPFNSIYGTDLNVTTKDGKTLSVATTLQRIMNLLGIVEPDEVLMDKYPSVKEAYDEYIEIITHEFAKIREAAKSYELIVKLVNIDHNSDADDTQ